MSKTQVSRRQAVGMVLVGRAALASARFGNAWSADRSSAPPMISREIPSSGEVLPVIGLGTWQTFDIERGAAEERTLEDALEAFIDLGGRLVDSSPMYRRSEAVVGEISATLNLRNRLFLATKVWTTGKEAGIRQMEESFEKLRATRIDLMQVHNLVDVATQLETLREWKQQGRIRYIGITHYTAAAMMLWPVSSHLNRLTLFRSTTPSASGKRSTVSYRWRGNAALR